MNDTSDPRPAATLYDVARLAGVSPSTVSRILNDTATVSASRRLAVEQAIAQLRFKPNLSARSLRSGTTRTIGILTKELANAFFATGVSGLDDGLTDSGYAPVIVLGHGDPAKELDRLRVLVARRVDAIVLLGSQLTDAEIGEFAHQVPLAAMDRKLPAPAMSFEFDQTEGGRMATRHLIDLGHRRIAHIAGASAEPDTHRRREGFLLAHADAGLPVDLRLVRPGDFSHEGGASAMISLLDAGLPFTAVCCANDISAWGACDVLRARGLRVPEDVSIVGFDDLPPTVFMAQPLTTVRQPIYDMARVVATSLLRALGQASSGPTSFPPLSLVVRASTAPAPAR